jgi:hypothetical protein
VLTTDGQVLGLSHAEDRLQPLVRPPTATLKLTTRYVFGDRSTYFLYLLYQRSPERLRGIPGPVDCTQRPRSAALLAEVSCGSIDTRADDEKMGIEERKASSSAFHLRKPV